MFERRLRIVAALGLVYFLALLGTLFKMQVLDAEQYRERFRALSRGKVRLPARRGSILDRHGAVLAVDRREWDLVVRLDHFDGSSWRCRGCGRPAVSATKEPPRRCPECRGREFDAGPSPDTAALARLLEMTPEEFGSCLDGARRDYERQVAREIRRLGREGARVREAVVRERYLGWNRVLAENVDPPVVKEVSLHPERYRGFSIRSVFRRANHAGPATKGLVGVTSGVYAEEKAALLAKGLSLSRIYRMRVGRSGLEKALEPRLASRDGTRIVDRDARGRVREVLSESPAVDGETVRTSIDLPLQELMTRELARVGRRHGARGAFFVALRPETGEVLVYAGYREPGRSGVNLSLAPVVPGSVFKVVTALAALQTGAVGVSDEFRCTGLWHHIGCHGAVHGPLTVKEALCVSCNGFFAWAAGETGIDALSDWARRLGFGEKTGLELPGEPPGLVPDPAWKAARFERDARFREYVKDPGWQKGETWQVGFGQGALQVTPVQVARLMAIVANGGRFVRPTLLLGEGRPGPAILTAESLTAVREGLEEAVLTGTARRTDLRRYRAAGKTGTGDLPGSAKNAAWFAGYAPADRPRIAFACCFLDVEGSGGAVAAPVCARFLAETAP